ncbi:MAG: hypothetical protein KY456_00885, partial [Chloroflexi bacterium]|nr:hypothetical protein [Chloroflexota bacterium]
PIEPHPLSLMVLRRQYLTLNRGRRMYAALPVPAWLESLIDEPPGLPVDMLPCLGEEFPRFAMLPAVPLSVRGAESAAERTSVLHYMPRSAIAEAYRDVGSWLEEHDPHAVATTEAVGIHV